MAVKKATPKRSVGQPTKYRAEFVEQVYRLCLLGASGAEIAAFFHVQECTVYAWVKVHREFHQAMERGRIDADARVAERLYQRALGYEHPAVKIFMPANASAPVYAPYTEYYPPDTAAAGLWLSNRQPSKWRQKTDHELTGKDGAPLVPVLNVTIGGDKP